MASPTHPDRPDRTIPGSSRPTVRTLSGRPSGRVRTGPSGPCPDGLTHAKPRVPRFPGISGKRENSYFSGTFQTCFRKYKLDNSGFPRGSAGLPQTREFPSLGGSQGGSQPTVLDVVRTTSRTGSGHPSGHPSGRPSGRVAQGRQTPSQPCAQALLAEQAGGLVWRLPRVAKLDRPDTVRTVQS